MVHQINYSSNMENCDKLQWKDNVKTSKRKTGIWQEWPKDRRSEWVELTKSETTTARMVVCFLCVVGDEVNELVRIRRITFFWVQRGWGRIGVKQ